MKNGLPKIHKHDNKKPKALGMFHNDRLIMLYTLESDLGDGWETDEEHIRITGTKLDYNKKIDALKMGTNIIIYVLTIRMNQINKFLNYYLNQKKLESINFVLTFLIFLCCSSMILILIEKSAYFDSFLKINFS